MNNGYTTICEPDRVVHEMHAEPISDAIMLTAIIELVIGTGITVGGAVITASAIGGGVVGSAMMEGDRP